MSIKIDPNLFDFSKEFTYQYLVVVSFLLFSVILAYFNKLYSNSFSGTSLDTGNLLVLSGLTITFYTLLEQVLDKLLGEKKENQVLRNYLTAVIILNIVLVSISILLILLSTIGYSSLKNTGFQFIASSWAYNIIILILALLSRYIEKIMEIKKVRKVINLILYSSFWILLIFLFLIMIGYYPR